MMDISVKSSFCFLIWSIFALTGPTSASDGCCGDSKESDSEWTLVMNYANFGAGPHGDNTITHCQCRQACLNLKGCTGYDWFPAGTTTKCWVGNNCPVTLTYDANNQHYAPTKKLGCYSNVSKTAWKLVMNYANFGAGAYGNSTTTHCQCRQACLDLNGCTGYDWFPAGTTTKCWIGNNCPVSLTYDVNNQHYIPTTKVNDCYADEYKGEKADKNLDRLCNRELCKKCHHDDD